MRRRPGHHFKHVHTRHGVKIARVNPTIPRAKKKRRNYGSIDSDVDKIIDFTPKGALIKNDLYNSSLGLAISRGTVVDTDKGYDVTRQIYSKQLRPYGMLSLTEQNNVNNKYMEREPWKNYGSMRRKVIAGFKSPYPGKLPKAGADMLAKVYSQARKSGYNKERSAKIAWSAVHKAGM